MFLKKIHEKNSVFGGKTVKIEQVFPINIFPVNTLIRNKYTYTLKCPKLNGPFIDQCIKGFEIKLVLKLEHFSNQ